MSLQVAAHPLLFFSSRLLRWSCPGLCPPQTASGCFDQAVLSLCLSLLSISTPCPPRQPPLPLLLPHVDVAFALYLVNWQSSAVDCEIPQQETMEFLAFKRCNTCNYSTVCNRISQKRGNSKHFSQSCHFVAEILQELGKMAYWDLHSFFWNLTFLKDLPKICPHFSCKNQK